MKDSNYGRFVTMYLYDSLDNDDCMKLSKNSVYGSVKVTNHNIPLLSKLLKK